MNPIKNLFWITLLLVSCNSSLTEKSGLYTADIRDKMNKLSVLELKDEIENTSFIPLEVTSDDASLIDGIADYAITDKYIYILPVKEQRIALFDSKGHFIKTLIHFGQGPGELNGIVAGIQTDVKNDRLYFLCIDRIVAYTLEGEFIEEIKQDFPFLIKRKVGKNRLAAIAMPYVTFEQGSYGIGLFTENGDLIENKNDFYSPLVSREKTGFTISLAANLSSVNQPVLFKTGANDTVFRITDTGIMPTCILRLKNSDDEVINSLDATDMSTLGKFPRQEENGDIFVSDLFETPRNVYIRFRMNNAHYVASLNKGTGRTLLEKCDQPTDIYTLSDLNFQFGFLGTKSYNNFPVWGRMEGTNLVQIVTPSEIDLYKDIKSITIPDELRNLDEDANPVFIVYKIKD